MVHNGLPMLNYKPAFHILNVTLYYKVNAVPCRFRWFVQPRRGFVVISGREACITVCDTNVVLKLIECNIA